MRLTDISTTAQMESPAAAHTGHTDTNSIITCHSCSVTGPTIGYAVDGLWLWLGPDDMSQL